MNTTGHHDVPTHPRVDQPGVLDTGDDFDVWPDPDPRDHDTAAGDWCSTHRVWQPNPELHHHYRKENR